MKRQNTRYFTGEEKAKFLRFLEKRRDARRAEMLYKLMFATGLRLQETVNLNVGDVQGRDLIAIIGKGDKLREIPLSKAIQQRIERFLIWKKRKGEGLAPEAPLFISRKKKGRLLKRAVQWDLNRWVRRAGLEGKYSPHALRHTVGFELMRKTRNIRQVQEFLGHSSIMTTQIYTHVTKEELRHCAELLSL
ncbi:MAG: tyrosine-type recombinase/integrase [Candidatus Omnitrophica bacterium]|nr:tyrosine-type recombinase/integrase [Candidatus Omnitrophota bacterium]MDD5670034.1 tyrosine-type recombinase/integrase [Candidatus Omnitrophota bacterium]